MVRAVNNGQILGLKSVEVTASNNGSGMSTLTRFTVEEGTSHYAFLRMLEFLYCGTTSLRDKHDHNMSEVTALAQKFEIPELDTYCQNITNDTTELNPSIGKTFMYCCCCYCCCVVIASFYFFQFLRFCVFFFCSPTWVLKRKVKKKEKGCVCVCCACKLVPSLFVIDLEKSPQK